MRKLILAGALLLLAGPAFANGSNTCTGGLCGQGASNVGPAQGQAQGQGQLQGQQQGQGQAQGQQLINQNSLNAQGGKGGKGGKGGTGGAGGAGGFGQGGSATGGTATSSSSSQSSATGGAATANAGGATIGNVGSGNTYEAAAYAPDAIANAPGFGISIGIGVCATQDSHSGGASVGVGTGPVSIGVSGVYGDALTHENDQCDYRAHSQIFCAMPRNQLVKNVPAGFICDSILSKLSGADQAMKEWTDAHAPKPAQVSALPAAGAPVQTASAAVSARPARCGFESPNSSWAKTHCN